MATVEHHDPDPITLAQYAGLPEDPRHKVEAVRGQLVRVPRPASPHSRVQARLIALLDNCVRERDPGGAVLVEFEFVLLEVPLTVRVPDVAYVSPGRLPAGCSCPRLHFGPDLAVEVVSPRNTRADLEERVADFLAAGTRLVWVADPAARTIAVHGAGGTFRLLGEGDELTGGLVLPGFRVPVLDAFPA